jgi:hypothetical protein
VILSLHVVWAFSGNIMKGLELDRLGCEYPCLKRSRCPDTASDINTDIAHILN